MTVLLFQICLLSTYSNPLFNAKRLNRITKAHVVAKRTTAPLRSRQRRTHAAPASAPYRHKRRRASAFARRVELLQQASQTCSLAGPTAEENPHFNSLDRAAVEHLFTLHQARMEGQGPLADSTPVSSLDTKQSLVEDGASELAGSEAMPPPPLPTGGGLDEHASETRSARSESTASRNTNRLSLTLPIAPPTACPSRPPPSSSTAVSSYPPTPIDTSAVTSPTDTNNFITAIAAQERRVLELREELDQAERELGRLKKQWTHHEAFKKRSEVRRKEPLRPLSLQTQTSTPVNLEDDLLTRRSVELDRRKALLLGQQSAQSTPTQSRRRVFRGAHTRTLSLLSPTKTTDDFSVHEDDANGLVKSPSQELEAAFQSIHRRGPITPAQLSKRASWAPRSTQQVGGLKQVADDFKAGLWTFVEDLRQATVGDEPITGAGTPMRGANAIPRAGHALLAENQETIKAPGSSVRPHVSNAFENTPTPPARYTDNPDKEPQNTGSAAEHRRRISKTEAKSAKRFSWTPLTVDSFDDNDWTNWDSPPVKSPRWSGTTVNGDLIDAIPEKNDENETAAANQRAAEQSTPSDSPNKLDDMSWAVLNRLTPGNIKRTASDFMKEWEKSLSPTRDGVTIPEENRERPIRTADIL